MTSLHSWGPFLFPWPLQRTASKNLMWMRSSCGREQVQLDEEVWRCQAGSQVDGPESVSVQILITWQKVTFSVTKLHLKKDFYRVSYLVTSLVLVLHEKYPVHTVKFWHLEGHLAVKKYAKAVLASDGTSPLGKVVGIMKYIQQ